jgi:hypothetical protein
MAKKGERGQGEGRKEIGGKMGLVGGTVQGREVLGLWGGTKPCDGARFRCSGFLLV